MAWFGGVYNGTANVASQVLEPHTDETNSLTPVSQTAHAVYVGNAPRSFTSAEVTFYVSTGATTITYSEIAIATGDVVLNGSPTLTVKGYASIAAEIAATGPQKKTVTLTTPIKAGEPIWLVVSTQATGMPVMRQRQNIDFAGLAASKTTTRPSLILNTATAFSWTTAGVAVPVLKAKV